MDENGIPLFPAGLKEEANLYVDCRGIRLRATLRSPIGVKPMNLFLEILRLSMYVTGIARNLYSIWREYKQ